jgi:oligopeptide transport system permease protein
MPLDKKQKLDSSVLALNLTEDLFAPRLANAEEAEKIVRPNLTYFQDAYVRFKKNKVGVFCACFLLFITSVGVFGPLFFPSVGDEVSYENSLNTDFQNQAPTLGKSLMVTDESISVPEPLFKDGFNLEATLKTPEELVATSLKIQGNPTVDGVTLEWEPSEGVSGYEIFRISGESISGDLENFKVNPGEQGMSVTRIDSPNQYTYTDSLGLDPALDFAFTVVPFVLNSETNEVVYGPASNVVSTEITKTIGLSDALQIDPKAEVGGMVQSRTFLFGTDNLGRDIFARMIMGTRVNFSLALIVPTICLLLGLIYGAISGLKGGRVDMVMMRIIEILDTLPYLLLMIILQLVMGKGMFSLIVALCAFGWTSFARVIRGEVLRLREIEFVHGSRLLGASMPRLIFKQIAPNLIGLILVVWSSQLPGVIVSEAFLSLLGLGLEAPQASWGMVLNESAQQFQTHPMQFLLPASVMASSLLAFFLLGDALTDTLDPKLRGRG